MGDSNKLNRTDNFYDDYRDRYDRVWKWVIPQVRKKWMKDAGYPEYYPSTPPPLVEGEIITERFQESRGIIGALIHCPLGRAVEIARYRGKIKGNTKTRFVKEYLMLDGSYRRMTFTEAQRLERAFARTDKGKKEKFRMYKVDPAVARTLGGYYFHTVKEEAEGTSLAAPSTLGMAGGQEYSETPRIRSGRPDPLPKGETSPIGGGAVRRGPAQRAGDGSRIPVIPPLEVVVPSPDNPLGGEEVYKPSPALSSPSPIVGVEGPVGGVRKKRERAVSAGRYVSPEWSALLPGIGGLPVTAVGGGESPALVPETTEEEGRSPPHKRAAGPLTEEQLRRVEAESNVLRGMDAETVASAAYGWLDRVEEARRQSPARRSGTSEHAAVSSLLIRRAIANLMERLTARSESEEVLARTLAARIESLEAEVSRLRRLPDRPVGVTSTDGGAAGEVPASPAGSTTGHLEWSAAAEGPTGWEEPVPIPRIIEDGLMPPRQAEVGGPISGEAGVDTRSMPVRDLEVVVQMVSDMSNRMLDLSSRLKALEAGGGPGGAPGPAVPAMEYRRTKGARRFLPGTPADTALNYAEVVALPPSRTIPRGVGGTTDGSDGTLSRPPAAPAPPALETGAPGSGRSRRRRGRRGLRRGDGEAQPGGSNRRDSVPRVGPPRHNVDNVNIDVNIGVNNNLNRRTRGPQTPIALARSRLPTSTAVLLMAENRGSYGGLLSEAEASITLEELGVGTIRSRRSQSGGVLLEIPGNNEVSETAADRLAGHLRLLFEGRDGVRVVRPRPMLDLRITGCGLYTSAETVAAGVAAAGGCGVEEVKVASGGTSRNDGATFWVACPARAALRVAEGREIRLGWCTAKVWISGPRPLRCYRCLAGGHTQQRCPSLIDRARCCFKCGEEGHSREGCSREPHCPVCAERGLPAGHRVGAVICPPIPPGPLRGVREAAGPTEDAGGTPVERAEAMLPSGETGRESDTLGPPEPGLRGAMETEVVSVVSKDDGDSGAIGFPESHLKAAVRAPLQGRLWAKDAEDGEEEESDAATSDTRAILDAPAPLGEEERRSSLGSGGVDEEDSEGPGSPTIGGSGRAPLPPPQGRGPQPERPSSVPLPRRARRGKRR